MSDGLPKEGDVFDCTVCGMSLVITVDCSCDNSSCVNFTCCGLPMELQPKAIEGEFK